MYIIRGLYYILQEGSTICYKRALLYTTRGLYYIIVKQRMIPRHILGDIDVPRILIPLYPGY